jgi:hypothetical protein
MKIYFMIVFIFSISTATAYKCNFTINIDEAKLIRFERDPLDCRVFHICAFNRTYTLSCVKGYYFDSTKNICNYANLVDCNIPENVIAEIITNDTISSNETDNVRVGEVSSIIYESSIEENEIFDETSEEDDDENEEEVEFETSEVEKTSFKSTTTTTTTTTTVTIPFETKTTTTTTTTTTTEKLETKSIEPTVLIEETTTVPVIPTRGANNSSKY